MELSKITIKKIRELIVFTAFLVVALWKFDVVLDVLKAMWKIIFPFVLGGAIAFVTNVPMKMCIRDRYYIENYPEIVVESGSLDQVILMLTGGER